MKITDQKDENVWPPLVADIIPSGHLIKDGARVVWFNNHEAVLTYFERRIEPYGFVRVQTSSQGLEIWVGGERIYLGKP